MKRLFFLLTTLAVCGCPATPKIVAIEQGNERQLNCTQLNNEIQAAEQAKLDAHKDDKFRFSDIFPPTGVISVANIWRAGDHAVARLELLNKIAQEKGCMNNVSDNNENVIILAQYFPPNSSPLQTEIVEEIPQVSSDQASNAPVNNMEVHNEVANATEKAPEEEDPASVDQSTDEYIKNGYDSEVYPLKDPKHFVF